MGLLGNAIREVRDTVKDSLEECGCKSVISEVKDVFKALIGK